ncbi:MAG: PAS domain-containing sensor histidine kinase [Rhizobacter sp.]|nr:PAS domain-containing sensor histidine kinase [Bacteriovorax sp.]
MQHLPFQAIFDHSSIGIIISNQDGVIIKANPYAAKMFGYGCEELQDQFIEILIPAHLTDKQIGYRKMYNVDPQPRTMGSNLNLLAVKKDGDQFPVEISLSYFESDGVRRIVSFVNDITVRKQSEIDLKKLAAELEMKVEERTKELSNALLELNKTNEQISSTLEKEKQLSELKSRFVSMASHEFRTPLSGIMTSASLIGSYSKEEDEVKRQKHVQTIKNLVNNLTVILNDFLSLDKLNHGKIISNPASFRLEELIEEVMGITRSYSEAKHNFILKNLYKELSLYQDKDLLRNVLINLVTNAIKYSAENSTIVMEVSADNVSLSISISDHGIGIPEKDQKHLFELFFRADNVQTIQGTGLGLNIVKLYLDMMSGELKFTSVENVGSTFTVILPLGNS